MASLSGVLLAALACSGRDPEPEPTPPPSAEELTAARAPFVAQALARWAHPAGGEIGPAIEIEGKGSDWRQ